MSEPFIGQIVMFGGNYAPRDWALCNGQLLAINSSPALLSILGTIYGGDGRTNFALPDLRGRMAVHAGQGPGLPDIRLGAKAGASTTTLGVANLPSHDHNHQLRGSTSVADTSSPGGAVPAVNQLTRYGIYQTGEPDTDMGAEAISAAPVGAGQAFNNMPPYQAVNYIIALVGTFPSRN
jgi:microcystin-dependent protein